LDINANGVTIDKLNNQGPWFGFCGQAVCSYTPQIPVRIVGKVTIGSPMAENIASRTLGNCPETE